MIRAGTKAMKRLVKEHESKETRGWLLPGLAGLVPEVWRGVSSPWVFTDDTCAGLEGAWRRGEHGVIPRRVSGQVSV